MPQARATSDRSADSLAGRAYREMKQDILMGRLVPGQVYLGAKLAESLRMSRTPVHEALKALAREGLVQVIPRVGYVVSTVTVNDVHEIFQLRLVLEATAVDLAAARTTPQAMETLQRFRAERREPRGRRRGAAGTEAQAQAHRDLHVLIASFSGNRRLVAIIGNLIDESQRLLAYDPEASEQRDLGLAAHADIIRSVERHDRRAASEAMRSHLEAARDRIMAALMPTAPSPRVARRSGGVVSRAGAARKARR